jgi:hypothetical protein
MIRWLSGDQGVFIVDGRPRLCIVLTFVYHAVYVNYSHQWFNDLHPGQ